MSQSVWPYDHTLKDESYGTDKALGDLWCFVICPSRPPAYWDELFALINSICDQIGKQMGVQLRCRRAVDIVSAGIIHPEIWRDIRAADFVIADITGSNGNVMFELGVASAWLDKERVIIIREDRPDDPRLFDINPARQVDYTRSPQGFPQLTARLASLIQDAIARAPFETERPFTLSLPVSLDLTKENDARALWGSSGAHRRILEDRGLEFGSLYNFRYGWVSVGSLIVRNVHVSGEFCFSKTLTNPPYSPWMGVMLRSQGYFANMGHLTLIRANGEVAITQEDAGQHKDVNIGKIDDFDPSDGFIAFDITISETDWEVNIGSVQYSIRISDLPHVFSEGRIILVGQFCWVGLRKLSIETV
jgi:hypothetical protein